MGKLYDATDLKMPVQIIRGTTEGPTVFLSAAIHGDEINGIEIIREVLVALEKIKIHGTVIAVPIVNVFGFNNRSRYLPDRRDLNRSFPGSSHGSLASRMAHTFMKDIVSKCTHGIDFHTGSNHRTNFPQIRADLNDDTTFDFAKSFEAPIIINSKIRDGSLREAARKKKVRILLFEGGQALRFEDSVVRIGRRGCLRALRHIGIIPKRLKNTPKESIVAYGSYWVRSPMGGTMRVRVKSGCYVKSGDLIGEVVDPLGTQKVPVYAEEGGYVIGVNKLPLVTLGEAIVHIATVEEHKGPDHNLSEDMLF